MSVLLDEQFVNLDFLFDEGPSREVDSLSFLYNNKALLKSSITKISNGILNNPLIIKDKKVLIKPNWVMHNRYEEDKICLCTHESFILAAIEVVLEQSPSVVIVGDAPIQGCNWDLLLTESFKAKIQELILKYSIPIQLKDFRRVTFSPEKNNPKKGKAPISEYIIFDLEEKSYLESISSSDKNVFRVNNYAPERLAESHKKGIHKYCLTKEVFDADIVISLPKVKTHQKTGITCALKNLVGVNGDKDYLPHHRFGGTDFGGDCYPGKNILRLSCEYLLDMANRRQGTKSYKSFVMAANILWRLSRPANTHSLSGGWYGNNTTWRMVLDLNRIAIYGKSDGTISENPQRMLYSLCDGIVAGQGEGPLFPKPLPLGVISFTNDSSLNDICMASLMGFDYRKIPLLFHSGYNSILCNSKIILESRQVEIEDLKKYSIRANPPKGWENYL